MKKLNVYILSLCLLVLLAFGMPKGVYASDGDGPQGGTNTGTRPPHPQDPPPPSGQTNPTLGTIVITIVLALAN